MKQNAKARKRRTGGTVYRVGRKNGRRVEWEDVHRDWVRSELQGLVYNVRPDIECDGEFVQPYRMVPLSTRTKAAKKRTR